MTRPFLAALVVGACSTALAAAPTITVGPNVHISAAHPTEGHFETHAAAHPADPSRLLATAIIYNKEARRGTVVYASTDAGKTWTKSLSDKQLL
ncbi:MAG TPA: hypothetical protein VM029_09285, partial [Opitutaceae bacterium]|nr:hypothetical protein [Opitutaceae bacterium]